MRVVLLLFLCISIHCCSAAKLPSSFKKCDRKQADFNDCLSVAILNAIRQLKEPKPEVNLPSFDPFVLPEISLGGGTKAVMFDQKYKNFRITHLTEITSLKANMDLAGTKLELDIVLPQVNFDFDYEIDGKVLMMPVVGTGPGHINIGKPEMSFHFILAEHDKGGRKFFKIKDIVAQFHKIASLHVEYENLFNGDKALGDNINQVINDNWQDIFQDIKPSYEGAAGSVLKGMLNSFFSKVSISELFGDA